MNQIFIPPPVKRRIAVIGAGISGMGAALALSEKHDVTLFEARDRLGGHARTLKAGPNRDIAVDTGFMVFNHENYPNLVDLFDRLSVKTQPTNMTFAVSMDDGRFEYGLTNIRRVLGDPLNSINPRFWSMIRHIFRFNQKARHFLDKPNITLGQMIDDLRLSRDFTYRYLYPLAGAIWSTTSEDMMNFPASTLIRFFANHGLLSAFDGPQWLTPLGGSETYVRKMRRELEKAGCQIRLGTPIASVARPDGMVKVQPKTGLQETFDAVVFACHSDQAINMLQDARVEEKNSIGQIRYRKNKVVLHSDPSQMPRRRACWSAWVYKGYSDRPAHNAFTYWMNLLQSLPENTPLFVTLNPQDPIDPALIADETWLAHPQYDRLAIAAQKKVEAIQGQNNSWFCGAWMGYGFHEDGLASGLKVANSILKQAPQAIA